MSIYLQKYTNSQSRFLVIDNALVHYRDEGEGPVVLLLHGAFSSLHTFDGWAETLKKDFRVLRLDLPGFGLSGASNDHTYGIEKYVNWIHRFLEMMGAESCSIAGSSFGGWLAWEYTRKYPQQVEKMILIGAAGYLDLKEIPLPFRMARTPFVNKIAKFVIRKSVLEVFVRQVYGDPSRITPALIDRYYDLFSREGNPEAFFALVNGRFKDNTRHLKKLMQPTLIQWGERDSWLPLDNAYRFLADIPHAELIIYEDIGHVPMEEVPQISVRDARKFLKEEIKTSVPVRREVK